jgi:hypothetical protein
LLALFSSLLFLFLESSLDLRGRRKRVDGDYGLFYVHSV